ncbi:unnamed protein product, partial [Staurois parvus]
MHVCHWDKISHITATYQCPSELPFRSSQCCLSVPISDTCQCPSVLPISASSSVPMTAASLAHISEGKKLLVYKIFI